RYGVDGQRGARWLQERTWCWCPGGVPDARRYEPGGGPGSYRRRPPRAVGERGTLRRKRSERGFLCRCGGAAHPRRRTGGTGTRADDRLEPSADVARGDGNRQRRRVVTISGRGRDIGRGRDVAERLLGFEARKIWGREAWAAPKGGSA